MRIYLDNCCFNRPYDNQLQPIIKLETEAKLHIQQEVIEGNLELVWSFILHFENNDNPFADKKRQIGLWEDNAVCAVAYSDDVYAMAMSFSALGIKIKDSLHLACAVAANAEYFITTDKKLLNKAVKEIIIINPIDFLRRLHDEG